MFCVIRSLLFFAFCEFLCCIVCVSCYCAVCRLMFLLFCSCPCSSPCLLGQGFDKRGFVWYTNFESRKSQEMAHNPYGALSFWWSEVQRAVRIEGVVCKVRRNPLFIRAVRWLGFTTTVQ